MIVLICNGCAWRNGFKEEILFSKKNKRQDRRQIKEEKEEKEIIVPGDRLYIKVKEDGDYGGIIDVSSNGYIVLPLINEIRVTSLSPAELAQIIKEKLEKDYFHKASVSVVHFDKQSAKKEEQEQEQEQEQEIKFGRVYVIGEVSRPGAINMSRDDDLTVAKAIIAAGGFTEYAKQNEVKLIRINENDEKTVKMINVREILKKGIFEKDVVVKDGDWIIVEENFF